MTANSQRRSRNPWLWVGLGAGLLTCVGSCAVGALVMLGVSIAPEVASRAPSPSPAADVAGLRQAFAQVRASVPTPAEMKETPCPDPEIMRIAESRVTAGLQGEAKLHVRRVSYESLTEFAEKGPTTLERPPLRLLPSREDLGLEPTPDTGPDDWLWLEDVGLREVFHPNLYEGYYREDSLRKTILDVRNERYLTVMRASERAMPRLINGGVQLDVLDRRRELRGGQSFSPGVFRGGIVVMDIETASVVCQVPLDVQSSPSLVYRKRARVGPMSQQPSHVLRDDFLEHFHEGARSSMGRITKLLDASW